ncbi:hypothetical protein [Stackebrandtia soli]|uniref:hypothetical protein n=1 Tax=Stackebrandtia soli TaxID=1892856 RepID=UPI0039E8598A
MERVYMAATTGQWHVRSLDDARAMNLLVISSTPDTGRQERWPDFYHGEIIAAALVQQPRFVEVTDERWDENAGFIEVAREDFPRLIDEIRRLRASLLEQSVHHDDVLSRVDSGIGGHMDDSELDELEGVCARATPGPWYVRELADDRGKRLVAVSTVPDTGWGDRWPDFDGGEIVAATLVQNPRYVDSSDGRWRENAEFIVMVRDAVPRLIAEVRRMQKLVARRS